jgi:hypothetical protein
MNSSSRVRLFAKNTILERNSQPRQPLERRAFDDITLKSRDVSPRRRATPTLSLLDWRSQSKQSRRLPRFAGNDKNKRALRPVLRFALTGPRDCRARRLQESQAVLTSNVGDSRPILQALNRQLLLDEESGPSARLLLASEEPAEAVNS